MQSGVAVPVAEEVDTEIDEGFSDTEWTADDLPLGDDVTDHTIAMPEATEDSSSDSGAEETQAGDKALDSHGIAGWDKVDRLAGTRWTASASAPPA
ncbi:UNVERIFIED_CONTAM: hypothetical protein FKN15_071766 [Acipenser sinensis]